MYIYATLAFWLNVSYSSNAQEGKVKRKLP